MIPIIVGARHEEVLGVELLSAYAKKQFVERIVPTIDEETLLLLEGEYRRHICAPVDNAYPEYHHMAEYLLDVRLPRAPLLGWKDERYLPQRQKKVSRASWIADSLAAQLDPRAFRCRSLALLLEETKKTPREPRFRVSPKYEEALGEWRKSVLAFDAPTIRAAKKHAHTHHVVIVCGACHALAIRRATGWNLHLLLPDTEKEATETWTQYNIAYDITLPSV